MSNRHSWPAKLVCGGVLAGVLSVCYFGSWDSQAGAGTAYGKQKDPLATAWFQVQVEGRFSGAFAGCSGMGSENEAVEHKMADKAGREIIQKIPGRLRWHDVTLTRAVTDDTKLWSWRQEVVVGKVAGARQKCTITMFHQEAKPVAVWELANAWPTDLKVIPAPGGGANAPMVEEVTITHEGVTRKQ
jgi:phage tail-like protein